ncbi:polymorphic toxin-type HINT domain-containing protein [Actinoplanes rectilineatus]|uniref:polymorphic toxin-type HINT domain-containing protein n=1 Tax=Actinoplanes rectilineatus TaxID=113571 RepID=UPI0006987841|nr:polymorphic toxin-type HINT domain-containing protein [Actinoplanes rectilineatus]
MVHRTLPTRVRHGGGRQGPGLRRGFAAATALLLTLGFLSPASPATAAAEDVYVDRAEVLQDLLTGGPSLRRAAEAALTGSEEDIRQYVVTGYDEAFAADELAAAQALAGLDGPALRTAAQTAIAASPAAVSSFVRQGWESTWNADERMRATRVLENAGGPTVKTAAESALNGSTADIETFLSSGYEKAAYADDRIAATRMLTGGVNNSGPMLDAAAKTALAGTAEDLQEFLTTGQAVARARDKELASLQSLTEQAKQASETAARETLAAVGASTRAANAAEEAKKAAQTAAAETKAAGSAAKKADAAAGRAADAAEGAADAAREAVGASNAAMRAARIASDAARQATSAAARTAQAAAAAQQAAANARTGAGDARTARIAAEAARDAAKQARELEKIKVERDRALAEAAKAALAMQGASANADAAAAAADEAGSQANVSEAQAARARAAAEDARRAAAASARAATRAVDLARKAAEASDQAFAFAKQAADHAERAADAAEAAADAADRAEKSATEASKHAAAAVEAANLAVTLAEQAATLETLARADDSARLAEATDQGVLRAQDALRQEQEAKAIAGEAVAWNDKLLWDTAEEDRVDTTTRQLLTEAATAGASSEVVLDKGRHAAVTLLTTGSEWTKAAAGEALTGGETELRSWLAEGRRAAVGQDDRAKVWRLIDTLPDGAEKTAADAALTGTDTAVETFLRTRNYSGKYAQDRIKIYAIINNTATGANLKNAAEKAVLGTAADMHKFLREGQYTAQAADDRIAVYQVMNVGGPEVKAAGTVALAGPKSYLSYFLTTSQYQAAQRDLEQAAHVQTARALVVATQQYAQTALADAAKANEAALDAWGKAGEADKAAAEAVGYANKAAGYANDAAKSANEAKASADAAAASATKAQQAAATAQNAANSAARSAATATAAAHQARSDANAAYAAKADARASAEAAGKDADAANAAATEASEIYTAKLKEVEAQRRDTAAGTGADGVGSAADDHKTWGCLSLDPSAVSAECLRVYQDFAGALADQPKCSSPANQNSPGCQMLGDLKAVIGENGEVLLDVLQFVLMGCGLIPGAGEVCDGIDAVVSVSRGDWVGGLLSLVSAVPIVGYGGTALKAWKNSDKLRNIKNIIETIMKGCKRNSFTAGTRVVLGDGRTRPIEELAVGDRVLATDPVLGRTGARAVTATIVGAGTKQLVDIEVTNDGTTETVTATGNHPFWVPEQRDWLLAEDLRVGDELLDDAGERVLITAVRQHTEVTEVYNLTVDDLHTYYVAAAGTTLLTHNEDPDACPVNVAQNLIKNGWNGTTILPGGGTVVEVGRKIWGNGKPAADRLDGLTDDQLRAIVSKEDVTILHELYKDAMVKIPSNKTAPARVDLTKKILDAWDRA